MAKITYENKEAIQNDAGLANKNKVTDADMNEIKQVVNANYDELTELAESLSEFEEAENLSGSVRIFNLSAGFYKVAKDSTICYKGTTDTTALSGMGDLLLFVTTSKDGTYKHWVMFNGTGEELGYIRVGHTTSSSGTYVEYKSTAVADLIEALNETALDLESTKQSLYQTQQYFVVNKSEELRIWDLNAGVHYLDKATVIYYAGATNIKAKLINTDYGFGGGILIITDATSAGGFAGKTWILLTNGHYYDGEKVNNGFVIFGFTTETDGTYYQYAIEDLDNVKKAVKKLGLDVSKLEQYRTEQAEQIQALQQENSLLKEQIPQGQAGGEVIVLEDSSNIEFKKFGIKGNYKQTTRSGYNQCDMSKLIGEKNGVTIAYNDEENALILNGTCTANNTSFVFDKLIDNVKNLTTLYLYYISGEISTNEEFNLQNVLTFRLYDTNKQNNVAVLINESVSTNPLNKTTSNLENQQMGSFALNTNQGVIFNNYTIRLMIANNTDAEYEQYGATPSVEIPSEIETTGENGSVNEVVGNGNLFDLNAETIQESYNDYKGNLVIDGDSIFYQSTDKNYNTIASRNWVIKLPTLDKDIYISAESIVKPYSLNAGLFYKFVDTVPNENEPIEGRKGTNISVSANGKQIKVTPTAKYLLIIVNAQYVKSSGATGQPEDRTVTVDKLMISYSKSPNYVRHEEQNITMPVQQEMLNGDYFDWKNEKEVHNWGKVESYNGEEITTEYISTTGELSTGATVYYKLATPTELDFTTAQKSAKEQIKNLHSYKNVTHIFSTDEVAPITDVTYFKDLETVINNNKQETETRLEAIETLLSTTETSAMLLDNYETDLLEEVEQNA